MARLRLDDKTFIIKTPTLRIKVLADHVYEDAFDEALGLDMMTEYDKRCFLVEKKIWNDEKELELRKCKDNIEGYKFRIYANRFNTSRLAEEKEELKELRYKILQMEALKSSYDNNTCDGYAQAARTEFILEKTVTPQKDLTYILGHMHRLILTERQLRFVARTEPWRSNYISNRQRAISLKPSNWGVEQCSLMIWSKMYDNIYNYDDKPESFVFDDDDMLDGWLIAIKKEEKRGKRDRGGSNDKPGYNESFIFLNDKDDPHAIEMMNSPLERMIKEKKINESAHGDIREVTALATAREQMMMEKP